MSPSPLCLACFFQEPMPPFLWRLYLYNSASNCGAKDCALQVNMKTYTSTASFLFFPHPYPSSLSIFLPTLELSIKNPQISGLFSPSLSSGTPNPAHFKKANRQTTKQNQIPGNTTSKLYCSSKHRLSFLWRVCQCLYHCPGPFEAPVCFLCKASC